MMTKTILVLGSILFLFSCKKEDDLKNVQTKSDYTPMSIGSYWIFENHYVDKEGTKYLESTDSTIISKDTLINEIKFYKLTNYRLDHRSTCISINESFLRDSSKNLIDLNHSNFFSENNFTDTLLKDVRIVNLRDTFCVISTKMERTAQSITVQTATFNDLLLYKETVTYGSHFKYGNTYNYRYYAKGIGKVCYIVNSYLGYQDITELIRYHINK